MTRLFADENFPLPVVEELRRLGHEVLTIQEVGKANQLVADDDVLALATSQNRTVLRLNRRHFIRLHDCSGEHAGIIVCTFDRDFAAQANRIHQAVLLLDDLNGQLVRVNRPAD